jgi:glutathione S-transferase
MQGQSNHFTRYAPERIEYDVNRYVNETRRLYGVLNTHLERSTSGYLVGDKCTIADIAHWGWITSGFWAGVDIEDIPALQAWSERMLARPAVEKGRHVPDRHMSLEGYKVWKTDPANLEAQGAAARNGFRRAWRRMRKSGENQRVSCSSFSSGGCNTPPGSNDL